MNDVEYYFNQIEPKLGGFDYIIAFDEYGTASFGKNPKNMKESYFFLTGILVTPNDLASIVNDLNKVKGDCLSEKPDFILHSRDLADCRKAPRIFRNKNVRINFYDNMLGILKKYKVFGAFINKKYLWETYLTPAHPYHASIQIITERALRHINIYTSPSILLWFERRGKNEDKAARGAIKDLSQKGYADPHLPPFRSEELLKIQWKSWFTPKNQNISLHQLVDFVAHYLGRYLNKTLNGSTLKNHEVQYIGWKLSLMVEYGHIP